MGAGIRFAVLGPIRIHHGDEVVEVTSELRRNLLAMLLLRANHAVSTDTLLEVLWRERRNPNALGRLQVLVFRLRAVLDDPDRLSADSGGYRLRVLAGELDSERFCTLLDQANDNAHDPQRCAELIREAMGWWRATPYDGVDLPDLTAEIQRLSERRVAALEQLYAAELRCGRHEAVIEELTGLIHRYPLRERLHALLVTALHQGGRRAEALAAYRDARNTLVDELGLEPGPELRRLEHQILTGASIAPAPPTASAAAPMQLPHNVSRFVGRDAELDRLDGLLIDGEATRMCVVVGRGGVGKTALVIRWAHRVIGSFPDGQLFIDLHGYSPDRPVAAGDALATMLRALGVDGSVIPIALPERAALFRTLVARKRMLIVLDNAHSADQVRPLLSGTQSCVVAITSRDTLAGLVVREGAQRIELDPMTADESRSLLRELVGDRCDDDSSATAELIERCARLPLALRIAAEQVRAHSRYRISDFVADLTADHGLDMLDIDGDPQTSVRAVFASSYRHLEPGAAQLFRMLGLHPGYDIDAYAATALVGDGEPRAARRHLEQLARASLVEESTNRRYQIHDLVRAYAIELAETTDTAIERAWALTRLFDYYLQTAATAARLIDAFDDDIRTGHPRPAAPALATHAAALSWLDTERSTMIQAALLSAATYFRRPADPVEAGLGSYVNGFSRALGWYLDLGWHHDDALALHTGAVTVAQDRGDAIAHGMALRHLAMLKARTGDQAQAMHDMESAAALLDSAEDIVTQAECAGSLGVMYGYDGRIDEAVHQLRHSVDLYRSIGYRSRTHWPLTHLGNLLLRQGYSDAAATYLHEALAIAEECGSLPSQAHVLYGLASLYSTREQFDDALRYGHRAVALARSARIKLLEGLALHHLGTVYRTLGNDELARRYQDETLLIFHSMDNSR